MKKLVPYLVSWLGVLGLAFALTYVVAIALSFTPGFEEITFFLVGESDIEFSYNFLLAGIPYAMLVAHLYMRTQLGLWMLDWGWVDEAEAYVHDKLESGLLRGVREVSHHRLAYARVLAARREYGRAWEILSEDSYRRGAPRGLRLVWDRWALEVALRREDAIGFAAVDDEIGARLEGEQGAGIWACRAEEAARRRAESEYQRAIENADYLRSIPRLAHVRAIAKLRMPARGPEASELGAELVASRQEIVRRYPFLEAETDALVQFLRASGGSSLVDPQAIVELTNMLPTGDSRADHVVRTIITMLDASADEEE